MSEQEKRDDPYFIEVDTNGCGACGHSKTWTVVGPGDIGSSTSYEDEDDASNLAEDP